MISLESIAKKIIAQLEQRWNLFENILCAPITQIPEFKNYLANYQGIANNTYAIKAPSQIQKQAQQYALAIANFFIDIFYAENIIELNLDALEDLLLKIEQSVNLSLYYWYGLNNRNYQFRTLMHFFCLSGFSLVWLTRDSQQYCVSLTEDGILFRNGNNLSHMPNILSIAKMLLPLQQNKSYLPDDISKIRIMQRETFLLVDEWEYQNAILALEYAEFKEQVLQKMDVKRNFWAKFCLDTICAFQQWANEIFNLEKQSYNLTSKQYNNSDLIAEIDALCALLLSAVQKLFLPAAISKLVYQPEIIFLFHKFFAARLIYCPEDFSSYILFQGFETIAGNILDNKMFDVLYAKTFSWKLCFDPSTGLRAFAWAYTKKDYIIFCAIVSFCFFKKNYLNIINESQILNLLQLYESQESFLIFLEKDALANNIKKYPANIEDNIIILISMLKKILDNLGEKTKIKIEDINFIINYLDRLNE